MSSQPTNMAVFEMARNWAEEPVTIFAKDLLHAESIYFQWIEAHHPGRPTEAHMAFPYFGRWLLGRPELGAASRLGIAGVGYWDRTGARWLIAEPDETPLGELARPATTIDYYRMTATDGDELMIFARSFSEAAAFYDAWHGDAYGGVPDGIVATRRSRWQLVLALAPLRDEMDAGIAGIARWSADEGWHIDEPEDGTVLSDHMR